jgi:hypothetical protein
LVEPLGSIDFSAITKFPVLLIYLISESVYLLGSNAYLALIIL